MPSARDIREFRGFLRNATDRQVQGIYDKEKSAGRDDYAELAVAEAERRGIYLEQADDDSEGTYHARKRRSRTTEGSYWSDPAARARVDAMWAEGKKKTAAQLDREVADILAKKSRHPTRAHAAIKESIPGIAKWNTTAGGTSAAEGKHGYTFTAAKGQYHIWPYTTKLGRHAGYSLKYAATGGPPRGGHSGLWHDLGTHNTPASAAKAAREHYARSFE